MIRIVLQIMGTQSWKFHNLLNDSYHNSVPSHDPGKFNFPSYVLSSHEKSLTRKELDFAMPPKNINHAKFFLPSAWLYKYIELLVNSNLYKVFIKVRPKDPTFSSH